MKYLLSVFIFVAAIIALESCECCSNKTITCPAYKDVNTQQWIPYTTKGQLIFATLAGEQDTIRIDSLKFSKETTQQNSCKQSSCNATFTIFYNNSSVSEKKLYFLHNAYDNVSSYSNGNISLQFLKANIYGTAFDEKGIVKPQFGGCATVSNYLPQATLNGTNFSNVQEIILDTATCKQPSVFSKLYLAKNKGIIGYQINTTGKLWVLQ